MIWFASDPHGCYDEFMKLLAKIDFSEEDEMYLLGDIVDRGPEPIKLLRMLMCSPNIYPLLGNHDLMMYKVLTKLGVEITEDSICALDSRDFENYAMWMYNGGGTTAKQFAKQDRETREAIMAFLGDLPLYEELTINDKRFILTHSGFKNFDESRDLDSYSANELVWARTDYSKRYFSDPDTYVVTGHTPTQTFRADERPEIYMGNGHIAIDCGGVFGGQFAAYCPETGECVYVEGVRSV